MLLMEINKYNNSIGYFSKNEKLSYSSTDIYIGTGDTKKPIIINKDLYNSGTSFYGCIEKIKIIYLNIIMQAIDADIPFTMINTMFTPDEIEEKIKQKLSKTSYKYPVYNMEKEDLENDEVSVLSREASIVINFHDSSNNDKILLGNTFDRALNNHCNRAQQNIHKLRLPYILLIMAFTETDILLNPHYIFIGRGLGIYNFFLNNELDHRKLINSRVSVLLQDDYNNEGYKYTLELFKLIKVDQVDLCTNKLKEQLNSRKKLNSECEKILNRNNSYIIKDNNIIRLSEIKKLYE